MPLFRTHIVLKEYPNYYHHRSEILYYFLTSWRGKTIVFPSYLTHSLTRFLFGRPEYQPVSRNHVDQIPLVEPGASAGDDASDSDLENDIAISESELKRDHIPRRTLIRVLAANGVIQIPIWGMSPCTLGLYVYSQNG
jgi:hypothetical protein